MERGLRVGGACRSQVSERLDSGVDNHHSHSESDNCRVTGCFSHEPFLTDISRSYLRSIHEMEPTSVDDGKPFSPRK